MKHTCPKCGSVVYESGLDKEGKHRGIDPKYECFIKHDEKGKFIPCRGCGEKYRMVKVGEHKEGPEIWQVLGLNNSPD